MKIFKKTESETAETLKSFLSNIVKNLNILIYSEFDSVTENIVNPTLKTTFRSSKYTCNTEQL